MVIIATGSVPKRLEIAGGKPAVTVHELVASFQQLHGQDVRATHELVANGTPAHGQDARATKRAVVFDQEGFNRALVAADLLSSRGVMVEFVTPLRKVGPKVESMMIDEMAHQLQDRKVAFHPGSELIGWSGGYTGGWYRAHGYPISGKRLFSLPDALAASLGYEGISVRLRVRLRCVHARNTSA